MQTHSKSTRNWSSKRTATLWFYFLQNASLNEFCFASLFLRFFTNNSGWTLPALFATLRDLRDLAFDVRVLSRGRITADISAGRRASTGRESEE